MSKLEDFTGLTIGKIRIIKRVENFNGEAGHSRAQWECQCQCGKVFNMVSRSIKRAIDPACADCKDKRVPEYYFERSVNGFMIRRVRK